MSQKFIASVQYDDMKGGIAIDGHEGAPLKQLLEYADIPSEFFPVGFKISRLNPDERGQIPISIVTVRKDKVGSTIGEIVEYTKIHGEVPVQSFSGSIPLSDFPLLFKRLDIKAVVRELHEVNVFECS